jgi:DNA-binding IclR family transcriptional regulator
VHSTGSGKALLAYLPSDVVTGILRRFGLSPRTPRTITDTKVFLDELAKTRERGFALDDEEQEEGVRCLAVPVRDASGQVVASLSVSGPVTRLNDEHVGAVIPELIDSGVKLSTRLGYAGEPAAVR